MKAFLTFTIILCCAMITRAQDLKMTNEIASSLKDNVTLSKLNYPQSVTQFYVRNNSEYAWIHPAQKSDQPEIAMLLLEYSYRFGLSLSDYHWDVISLQKLKKLRDTPTETTQKEKAMFDILMTDALITFINNLHFGKYNPSYSSSYIDINDINGFRSENVLLYARQHADFLKMIVDVQPKIKAYTDFQNYLNTLYAENDCIAPQTEIQKIIINMERLRWINNQSIPYILINIPSYALEFHQKEIVSDFKVIIGKPTTKTPVLESKINYFTTAPDWKVPQSIFVKEMLPKILKNKSYLTDHPYSVYDKQGNEVEITSSKLKEIRQNPHRYSVRQSSGCDNALGAVVFRFENSYGVYLHDTSQKQLFNKDERAFSHGCIRVENAKELASLLLENDGSGNKISILENAMADYQRKDFVLKQPVPIIITYLTCLIKDGKPVLYKDIYHFDDSLENKFNQNK
ncbi:murein L,D-transpeptidase YcbB/YkuD [Chryseobacterium ginsenosidimutans]|uniref:L,D-transpeptidase family protein n=1 Tax=Chryseobacterium ginsenosidimutans TaxID=687846 RepID=UPI00216A0D98|nr:L,D-transpeptidase family protein [Chryseobacterium ginsenosidimutans]MCS3869373.1 murein L,D-transpeptidase YcbB/YkuD [Chryseobacterium ginsenosidimutans]